MILNDLAENLLTAYSDLAIYRSDAACGFVRSIHQRVIETEPFIKDIRLIQLLELLKRQSRWLSLAKSGPVLLTCLNSFEQDLQVSLIVVCWWICHTCFYLSRETSEPCYRHSYNGDPGMFGAPACFNVSAGTTRHAASNHLAISGLSACNRPPASHT